MALFFILLAITILFFILLIVKSFIKNKKEFCAICFAVGVTWLGLLILYWLRIFENNLILGILIGQTTLGIFYTLEKKFKKELTLFRLPALLSLIFIAYSLIELPKDFYKIILFLIILWIIFILVYFYRNNSSIKNFFDKIVECCKKW